MTDCISFPGLSESFTGKYECGDRAQNESATTSTCQGHEWNYMYREDLEIMIPSLLTKKNTQ